MYQGKPPFAGAPWIWQYDEREPVVVVYVSSSGEARIGYDMIGVMRLRLTHRNRQYVTDAGRQVSVH